MKAAVARGYAVVVQDVRGRYGSDGEFVPYRHEGKDGYDTIEWAAAQPWSDGQVGTFGLSYPGAVQWLAAVESPPAPQGHGPGHDLLDLRATSSTRAASSTCRGPPGSGRTSRPTCARRRACPGPRTYREAEPPGRSLRDPVERRLPISDLPEFRDARPLPLRLDEDPARAIPRWDWMETAEQVRPREGGGAEPLRLVRRGLRARKGRPPITSGSWPRRRGEDAAVGAGPRPLDPRLGHHERPRAGQVKAGERVFGPTARRSTTTRSSCASWTATCAAWTNGLDRETPVRVFVMGENAWRDEDAWPPAVGPPADPLPREAAGRGGGAPVAGGPARGPASQRLRVGPPRPRDRSLRRRGGRPRLPRPRRRARTCWSSRPRPSRRTSACSGPSPREIHVSTDAPRHRPLAQALRRGCRTARPGT